MTAREAMAIMEAQGATYRAAARRGEHYGNEPTQRIALGSALSMACIVVVTGTNDERAFAVGYISDLLETVNTGATL